MTCPACNHKKSRPYRKPNGQPTPANECTKCGAVFGTLYLGESYGIVKPWMTAENIDPNDTRYYDFECLGSEGITRRHGWFDPSTGLIVQVG